MLTPRHGRLLVWVSLSLVATSLACSGATTTADSASSGGSNSSTGGQAATGGQTSTGGDSAGDGALEEGDECIPYDDACGPTLACQIVGDRTRCAPAGTTAREERCEGSPCQRGSVCAFNGYNETCQQPCTLDETVRCEIVRQECHQAVDAEGNALPFGVCRY